MSHAAAPGVYVTVIALALGASTDGQIAERLDGVRVTTLFTFLRTVIAYRRRRHEPDLDPFPIITRWTVLGLALGTMIEVVAAVS